MADLETLIDARLAAAMGLTSLLATFDEQPAVLLSPMPADVDRAWSAVPYPKIEWRILRTVMPERHLEGQVIFDVLTGVDAPQGTLEAVERALKAALDGSLYHPDVPAGEPVEGLRWSRSDDIAGTTDTLVIGRSVTFDLFAFPSQETSSPDPIAALNTESAAYFVTALQVDPASWGPTDATPALYWRLADQAEEAAYAWGVTLLATIRGHVQAPTVGARNAAAREVRAWLSASRNIPLGDGSYLRVVSTGEDRTADPQREGQVTLTARYGVLATTVYPQTGEPLRHAVGSGAAGLKGGSVEVQV